MTNSKVCAYQDCSNILHRPTGDKRITLKQWKARKFCGKTCSGKRRLERDKVCSNPNCIHRGVKQAIKKFAKDCNNPDGHKAQCYGCWKRSYDIRRKELLPWEASPNARLPTFALAFAPIGE